ncbi:MAG: molybdopterin converting factor small subunit [Symbiobacteriaceae bacterium]|jgi:molybdopterin synthase sulfur carrier subunit|nr:molybdopterin converting factor small subunit [Symbiobacteriaceae bacterium]
MRIRLFATLRPLVGGKHAEVPALPGETVRTVLDRLIAQHPRLAGEVLTPDGSALLPHVQVFIGGESIRHKQGLDTVLEQADDMAVFPPVAGG